MKSKNQTSKTRALKVLTVVCTFLVMLSVSLTVPMHNAHADDVPLLNVGLGYFDTFGDHAAAELRVEYRDDFKVMVFKPFAGLFVTSDGSLYGYTGIYSDFPLTDRLTFTPSVAPGYYHRGEGKDLGHEFEIKSSLELSYRMDNDSRIGLHFHHMSNAGLGNDNNPGIETIGINLGIPLK